MTNTTEKIKAPAFQFYVRDFLSDANQAGMSAQETGVYIRLMCYEWNEAGAGIPDDLARCARMGGITPGQMRRSWPVVRSCFVPHPTFPERLMHPRLEKERQKQAVYRRRQSDKGKASAANRKPTAGQPEGNRGSTGRQPDPQPTVNSAICDLRSADYRPESKDRTPSTRAGDFCRWYEDTHHRLFTVGYMGTQKDYQTALQLVGKFTDRELQDAALVWFGQDDDFALNGTRTIPKFASRVTHCLQTIKAKGIA